MHKIPLFCFVFLLTTCSSIWSIQFDMQEEYNSLLSSGDLKATDLCLKISSSTDGVPTELLFGIGASISYPFPDMGDPSGGGFDYYFTESDTGKKMYVLFSKDEEETNWHLFVVNKCTLRFTLLGGEVPEYGSLKLFDDEKQALLDLDIDETGQSKELKDAAGNYIITYVPTPKRSYKESFVEYKFVEGWNLLHFPIVVYENDPRKDDNWEALNSLPRQTLSGRTYIRGGDIRCGEAFWVFYEKGKFTNDTLTVLGYEPVEKDWPDPMLKSSWNFTGVRNNTERLSNNTYEWAESYKEVSDSAVADPRKGYWINKP